MGEVWILTVRILWEADLRFCAKNSLSGWVSQCTMLACGFFSQDQPTDCPLWGLWASSTRMSMTQTIWQPERAAGVDASATPDVLPLLAILRWCFLPSKAWLPPLASPAHGVSEGEGEQLFPQREWGRLAKPGWPRQMPLWACRHVAVLRTASRRVIPASCTSPSAG